jgi:oligosaccharyltransferase complex subunit alpha (ribophorin I)
LTLASCPTFPLFIPLLDPQYSLKGHFSRIDHQKTKHFRQPAPQVLSDFALHLPPHIKNPYYYDIIGNVSTSNFRPTPPAASKRISARSAALGGKGGEESLLELRPRYPILGGWNYTFTVGWDADLGDVLKKGESSGEYVLGVPFLTGLEDVAVDEVEFVVVLPEGASYVYPLLLPLPSESSI